MIKIVGFEESMPNVGKPLADIPLGTAFIGRVNKDKLDGIRIRTSRGYLNLKHLDYSFYDSLENTTIHDYEEVDLEIKVIRR